MKGPRRREGLIFGMFGTGFNSFFKKTDDKSVQTIIKMCLDINDMTDDEEMFQRTEQVLVKGFKGMRAAAAEPGPAG